MAHRGRPRKLGKRVLTRRKMGVKNYTDGGLAAVKHASWKRHGNTKALIKGRHRGRKKSGGMFD